MRTETRTYTKTIYIASDGKEFFDEISCDAYELELEQGSLEKRAIDKLLVTVPDLEFPSLWNDRFDHELNLFLIKNEEDLDLFNQAYEYWFTNIEKYPQVDKATIQYPEVLCILDFPTGGDEHRLYRFSSLLKEINAFSAKLDEIVKLKE